MLSVLVEAVTDFAVVVSSNRVGIISVVEASKIRQDDQDVQSESDRVNDDLSVPISTYLFDVKKIQPIITSRARDIIKVRITIEWTASHFQM